MKTLLSLLAGVSAAGMFVGQAQATPRSYNVPAQPLSSALQQFALQGGDQVLFTPGALAGKRSKGVSGSLESETALRRLLDGAGVGYRRVGDSYVIAMQDRPRVYMAAAAQPTASPAEPLDEPPAPAPTAGLQEIVVTAQKRAENLQDTPLAISAVTADTIEGRGLTTISNLSAAAPNLNVTQAAAPGNAAIFIRGLGNQEPILTADSPVGLYIDGIIVGRSAGSVFDIAELERIEVLRGPQGTLYGRNTIGGAINLITRKPGDELEVRQKLSFGNFGYWQSRTTVDMGELGDTGLRAMLTYLHKQRDGYVDNLNQPKDSRDPGAYNTDGARVAVTYDQGGPIRADYTFTFNHNKAIGHPQQLTVARPDVIAAFAGSQAAGGDPFILSPTRLNKVRYNDPALFYNKVWGHTLTLEADLGEALTIRSLTGYRKLRQTDIGNELDGQGTLFAPLAGQGPTPQPITLFTADALRRQHQWSQELNLLGNVGQVFEYVLGGYYFREKGDETNPQTFGIVTANGVLPRSSLLAYSTVSQTTALFAQGTAHVTDRFNLTGGVRYTWDKKQLDQISPLPRSLDRKFRNFNWTISADYKVTDEILTYARIATGYKAGGVNPRATNTGYEPEDLTSYEVGLKSDLFDRRLRFNAALFYAKHKDVQVTQSQAGSNGAASISINAGKATYKGVELEVMAIPVDGLTLSSAFGYVHRKYNEFIVLNPANNKLVDIAKTGEARFTYSPSTTLNAGIEYKLPPFDFGQIAARLDYNYRTGVSFNPSPFGAPFREEIAAGSRGLLDARLTLSDLKLGGTDASVALWGQNITGEKYRIFGLDFGGIGYGANVYGEPATYGIDLTINFR